MGDKRRDVPERYWCLSEGGCPRWGTGTGTLVKVAVPERYWYLGKGGCPREVPTGTLVKEAVPERYWYLGKGGCPREVLVPW